MKQKCLIVNINRLKVFGYKFLLTAVIVTFDLLFISINHKIITWPKSIFIKLALDSCAKGFENNVLALAFPFSSHNICKGPGPEGII